LTAPVSEKGYASQSTLWWPDDDEKTPELIWPRSVEVYGRMRRQDAQVGSVLRAVTLPIRRTAWRLDPNGAKDEVVHLCSEDIGVPIVGQDPKPLPRTRDRFSFTEHLRLALTMLPYGHSFFEQQARYVNGRARLRKLGWRPPKTISKFDVADDGGLVAIEQHAALGKGNDRRIPVDHLVAYVHDREGGAWTGQSLLRPGYKFWLLKDRALRTQAQTVERNGLGIPVYKGGKYPEDMDPADRQVREDLEIAEGAKLAAALRGGDNSGAAVRNGADLELMGVSGTLPDADPVIRYYDEQIARAVLAHFLNLGTETGSWALGSTFADFFTLSLESVAQTVDDVFSQHVIEDMVDWNWGPEEPAPRLVHDEIGSRHPATADAIQKLIACGALTADEPLEQYLRTTYGLPAHDAATAREKPAAQPAGPAAPPTNEPPQQQQRRLV
jgi:hypothetical protein